MSKISANGISIDYELDGPEGAPVVTMSHSLSANLQMWDPQVSALRERYRVLRYDTRGHGGTEATESAYSLEQLAGDVVGLLAALKIDRTHFVGLSLGGMIGQTLAVDYPQVLRSLTLCDTSSGYGAEGAAMWKDRITAARQNGLEANVEPTIDRWFSPGFVKSRPDLIDKVRAMIRATPVDGYIGCGHAISKLNLTERLAGVTVPTLIIVGEDDPGTPVAMSRVMHEKIKGSELVILPVARHLANMEDVDGFNAALMEFLGKH